MMKASEEFVDALYYHEMYGSAAYWKTADMISCDLGKFTSKNFNIDALKEHILMRILVLAWSDMATPWSRNGKILTLAELPTHLKLIIVQQRSRSILDKPQVMLPERK